MDQRRAWPLPLYLEGMPHASGHTCTVRVCNGEGAIVIEVTGSGATKKSAQMQAAERALEEVRKKHPMAPRNR